jgi:hypothetical protein
VKAGGKQSQRYGVISQEIELFITTAARTSDLSDPTSFVVVVVVVVFFFFLVLQHVEKIEIPKVLEVLQLSPSLFNCWII